MTKSTFQIKFSSAWLEIYVSTFTFDYYFICFEVCT